jgi:hypothetical protein
MAYLPASDKTQQDEELAQEQQEMSVEGSGGALVQGSGGNVSPNAAGDASKPWTNIQAYLSANKDSKASGDMLKSKVGGAFTSERDKFQQEASSAKSQADQEVNSKTLGMDQASKLISEASMHYSQPTEFKPGQSMIAPQPVGRGEGERDPAIYQEKTKKVKDSLSSQYAGPNSFTYGMDGKVGEYGGNLGSDNGFRSIMNSLYRDSAQGNLSPGVLSLQEQLDVNNPYLNQMRGELGNQYGALTKDVGAGIQDTNKYVQDKASEFVQRQNDVRSGLGKMATDSRGELVGMRDSFNNTEELIKAHNRNPWGIDEKYIEQPELRGYWHDPEGRFSVGTSPLYVYQPGGVATEENVGGGDPIRRQWNTIQDVLGLQDRLAVDQAAPEQGHLYLSQTELDQERQKALNAWYQANIHKLYPSGWSPGDDYY